MWREWRLSRIRTQDSFSYRQPSRLRWRRGSQRGIAHGSNDPATGRPPDPCCWRGRRLCQAEEGEKNVEDDQALTADRVAGSNLSIDEPKWGEKITSWIKQSKEMYQERKVESNKHQQIKRRQHNTRTKRQITRKKLEDDKLKSRGKIRMKREEEWERYNKKEMKERLQNTAKKTEGTETKR